MKRIIFTIAIVLVVKLLPAQTTSDSLQLLSKKIGTMEQEFASYSNRFDRLDIKIDKSANDRWGEVIVPVFVALIVGVITLLLGYWGTKGRLSTYAEKKIEETLEVDLPVQCNIALMEYLKKSYPGDLKFLEAAWKQVAYDSKLRQTKIIRILSKAPEKSKEIRDQIMKDGFLQVEIVPYQHKAILPEADLILIDRYSCRKEDEKMSENDVKTIIEQCKESSPQRWMHYFGDRLGGLMAEINEHHALSSAQFSLGPNIMDQLRFAWPMKDDKKL